MMLISDRIDNLIRLEVYSSCLVEHLNLPFVRRGNEAMITLNPIDEIPNLKSLFDQIAFSKKTYFYI